MLYDEPEKKPFFSILVPSYNRPEYIKQCIESVLKNDFEDYEIIISDDKSPRRHEIESLMESYRDYPNIYFFGQSINLREPGNKNFLVSQAKGKYNIVLGDDDKFYPYTLKRLFKHMERFPGYDLYGFGYTIIDENDQFYYSRYSPKYLEISMKFPSIVYRLFTSSLFPFWLYHPATFCCKSGVERELTYSNEAGIGEDLQLIFDLVNSGRSMLIIPESLFFWRKVQNISKTSQVNQSLGDLSNIQARLNIYNHLNKRKDLNPFISNLILKSDYRKKFVYNSTFSDNTPNKLDLLKKNLCQEHIDEFIKYSNEANILIKRFKPYIDRSLEYTKLFGFQGFSQILKVFFQRAKFRLRSKFLIKNFN